jgi:hypothetical protein
MKKWTPPSPLPPNEEKGQGRGGGMKYLIFMIWPFFLTDYTMRCLLAREMGIWEMNGIGTGCPASLMKPGVVGGVHSSLSPLLL